MSDNTATIVGNLTRTPVLRYTANNIPVTDLMVAVNHRRKDPMTEQWRDVTCTYYDVTCTYYTVTCWRTLAEHAVRTFEKGHRVIVIGRMYVEEWTGREGDVRQSIRIEPSSVGLDIRFSPAAVAPRPSVQAGPSVPSVRDTDDAVTRWGVPPTEAPDHDGYDDVLDEAESAEVDELARLTTAPASSG
ncbi:single-stranded DNA-binding protein [Pseudonocardia sp. EV170527-09]|uniref:single-stranded DNA-binding protein n=1 Tax=Pseudonocardia sp. EV170527-09 TaxID=2603411 RepID=UPI001386D6B4|nr:single-stranded DNA-binding protein [Pseudonocardia sp. EV170527-09]